MAGSLGYKGALPSPSQIASQVQPPVASIAGSIAAAAAGILAFVVKSFIVLTLAFLLVVRSDEVVGFWVSLFAPKQRKKVRAVTSKIGDRVGYWLLGQLAVAAITGTLAGIGSAILGLPYPVILGVTTAIIDLAPAVGPTAMAGRPGCSVSRSPRSSGSKPWPTSLSWRRSTVTCSRRSSPAGAVKISPVVVVIAVPVGIALYGPVGGLLSVPVAASIQVVLDDVVFPWLHRHERSDESAESSAGTEAQQRAA